MRVFECYWRGTLFTHLLHVNHENLSSAKWQAFQRRPNWPKFVCHILSSRLGVGRGGGGEGFWGYRTVSQIKEGKKKKKQWANWLKKLLFPNSLNTLCIPPPTCNWQTLLAKRQKQKLLLITVEWIIMLWKEAGRGGGTQKGQREREIKGERERERDPFWVVRNNSNNNPACK